ncbi:hypothetical protein J6590_028016 [Homalodisca vitripennis]|nr:hypothetical protein J6590_028016 [Homalodisca vitripennis]
MRDRKKYDMVVARSGGAVRGRTKKGEEDSRCRTGCCGGDETRTDHISVGVNYLAQALSSLLY